MGSTDNHLDRIKSIRRFGIKISLDWCFSKTFEWIVDNASFIFTHHNSGRLRLYIVSLVEIEGCDCFEISNDRFGIKITACAKFNEFYGNGIIDSSKDVPVFIKEYLENIGCSSLFIS